MASKYDPVDYSTVHHWDSLLRFCFLGNILGSETQGCNLNRLVESRWNNAAWCSEGLKENMSIHFKKVFVGLCKHTIGCLVPSLHKQSIDSKTTVK